MAQGHRIERCKKGDTEFIERFLQDMRPTDIREISVIALDLKKELMESVESSEDVFKVIEPDGTPLALFGNVPQEDGRLIWCVGTNALQKHWKSFALVSRKIILRWADMYGRLYNCIATFNEPSILWLRWLGAEFGREFNVNGQLFMRFEIRGK